MTSTTTARSRRQAKEELLALLTLKAARVERQRIAHDADTIRANCRTLHGFIREFWRVIEPVAQFRTGWALQTMCDHLEAVSDGHIRRLLMTVPPGMMKSLVLVFWTAWEWGPRGRPDLSVLATSFSRANAFRDNLKLRDLVTSEKFKALWPEVTIRADAFGTRKFINTASGFSEARPFSKMTGGRANRVKIDDPHDTESAESQVQREGAVRIMREAISDRVNSDADAIVLIMQRLHEKDCAAVAMELGYVHLNLPMEFEPDRRCVTVLRPANDHGPAILFTDPRQAEGELLFPERFSASWCAELKGAKGSYAWAGQYQQRPAPRDGGMFKREWFKVLRALPVGITKRVRGWDFGATEGGGDPTAAVRCEMTDDRRFVFTNVRRARLGPAGVESLFTSVAASDGPGVTIRIPQDPGAAGKSYAAGLVRLVAGYPIKVVAPTGDKETRATALAAQAEAGNVYVLATGDPARDAWIEPFIEECCTFGPGAAHDDQVDAAADAFNELALGPSDARVSTLRL